MLLLWRTFLVVLVWISSNGSVSLLVRAQMQATWTPNPNDDAGGPLPLSTQQRDQLLRLHQQIQQSPNPEATLHKVATQNGLDAADLARTLQRAASEHGASHAAVHAKRPTHLIWTTATTILTVLGRIVLHHPRITTLLALTLMGWIYLTRLVLPETGLVWSSGPRRAFLTKGHTTLFAPPTHYLQQQLQQVQGWNDEDEDEDHWSDHVVSSPWPMDTDGVTWHDTKTLSRLESSQPIHTAVTAQVTVRLPALGTDHTDLVRSIGLHQAAQLLDQLELTEFASLSALHDKKSKVTPHNPRDKLVLLGAHLDDEDEDNPISPRRAILVVPGMGDWGRYGLLPLSVSSVLDTTLDDDESTKGTDAVALRLSVAPGGHWTGDIYVTVWIPETSDDTVTAQVQVTLVVPKAGRVSPSRAVATAITLGLARSVARSVQTRTQLTVTRQGQSQRLQTAAHTRATDRRSNRSRLERQMEDMAVERRRRWQRKNPSGVSNYRPSGERMRSPNHASYP